MLDNLSNYIHNNFDLLEDFSNSDAFKIIWFLKMECGEKASARAYWGNKAKGSWYNLQDLQDNMESYQEAALAHKVGMSVELEREWLGEYITHDKIIIFTIFTKGTCKNLLVTTHSVPYIFNRVS